MKKITLLLVLICYNGVLLGQNKNDKFQKIKVIEWNYLTKSFTNDSIQEKLRVNDVVKIKLINMPTDYAISSNVTFMNNHLELRGSFGENIVFSKDNPYIKGENTTTTESLEKDLEKKDDEIIKNRADTTISNKTQEEKTKEVNSKEKSILKQQLIKATKISSKDLDKALEIEIAKKFISDSKNNEKAIEDIKWQEHLIKIAKKNWQDQLDFRNSLIDTLSNDISSLKLEISKKDSLIETLKSVKTHYFSPFKIENYDFTEFIVEITDNTKKNVPMQSTFSFPFKNKGGFKLDFSTGILATGLYSPNYKFYTSNNVTQIKEAADPTSKFNTGIALMAHAYSRSGKYVNLGVGSGFSYNLNSQNLNYLLGASLLWGEEQRFITTIGLNVGKVKELSNYYKIDTDYDTSEFTPNAEVPTVDVLKASWFISITYNLGIGNPSKTKKI